MQLGEIEQVGTRASDEVLEGASCPLEVLDVVEAFDQGGHQGFPVVVVVP